MREEQWALVDGYKEEYKVSSFGRVESLARDIYYKNGRVHKNKGRMLKIQKNPKGYAIVVLSKEGRSKTVTVHRLVARAFIKNHSKKSQINHKDGDKANNRVENLEWCTGSENMVHAVESKLYTAVKGSRHYNAKLKEEDILYIRKLPSRGIPYKQIAEMYNVGVKHVQKIISRERWKHI